MNHAYGINTNELDAASDVVLRALQSARYTLDRMPMRSELRDALVRVLGDAARVIDDVTLTERLRVLDQGSVT